MKIFRPLEDILKLLTVGIIALIIYVGMLLIFNGCQHQVPPETFIPPKSQCITDPPNVAITLLEESIPLTCQEKQHIIKRTNSFCKERGRDPVRELVVTKHKRTDESTAMTVRYYCSWSEDDLRTIHIR